MTDVIQFVVLSLGSESATAPPVTTVLVISPVKGALTVNPRLVAAPLAKLGTAQNTFVRLALVAPPPVALMKVRFAGRLSVTTSVVAVEGPTLVTVIV